jgi:phage portal protein BeeE
MGLFSKPTKAMISTEAPASPVAAASAGNFSGGAGNIGSQSVGNYYSYTEGVLRNNAMSVPTIARARDLIASIIGATPLRMYKLQWNDQTKEMDKVYIAPRAWLRQPDPAISYSAFMSWLFDDLFFFGKAVCFVKGRSADGFPVEIERLPASMVTFRDQAGPVFFSPSKEVYFQGGRIDPENLIQFVPCPIQGIVYQSEQSVQTAIRLEKSRYRNASSTIPAGILRVTGGEPLTAEELGTLASQFNSARENNQTAAISQDVEYTPTTANPANMLLMEAANFQALEMTRITNIPPYLAGIDIGSYQYTTGKQSREDLYLFAARLYMQCIAETLSMNNVLPIGTYVDFDIDEFLSDLIETDYEESLVEEAPTMNQGGMNNA